MFLSEQGLSNRIHWKVKTIIYDNLDTISTDIEMEVRGHTLEEVKGCLREIEGVVTKLEQATRKV